METILLIGIINIILGFVLWFMLFRTYFIDSHRHELFKLRYELFDYAKANSIDFNSPVFLDRWKEINGMIRFAADSHIFFLLTLFHVFSKDIKSLDLESITDREKNLRKLPKAHQEFFEKNRKKQRDLFFVYIVKSSLCLLIPVIILSLVLMVLFLIQNGGEKYKRFKKLRDPLFEDYNQIIIAH